MDLPNRPIKREGITRPINESPKTLQAWQYSKGPTEFYLTAGGQKNLDAFAQDRFGVRYDRLKDTDQTLIRNAVKTEIRKDPELQAWLYFWDGKPIGDVAKLRTVDPDTVDILAQLYKKYGAPK